MVVSRGSILGLLLLLVKYINDLGLLYHTNSPLILYANDTTSILNSETQVELSNFIHKDLFKLS